LSGAINQPIQTTGWTRAGGSPNVASRHHATAKTIAARDGSLMALWNALERRRLEA
jgi:hypothetical protein